MPDRHAPNDLIELAQGLLVGAGLSRSRARTVAELLVEADLMGHTTHGLAQLPDYLDEIANGTMAVDGEPLVVSDRGACLTLDGRRLPGVWLVAEAIETGLQRLPTYGTVTIVIRHSHHIACLAAYLPRATAKGAMIILACSDPSEAGVAPHGGIRGVFTPDPIAVGIPTDGDPILIDMSSSITTMGMAHRRRRSGRRLDHPWLQDANGHATDDPAVLVADPPGTLLPTGGIDHGHKGYGLALMVEALTQGLGAFGRSEGPKDWGAAVFIQLLDPAAFGGEVGFLRETSWTAEACRRTPPRQGVERVRLPGEAALARRRKALAEGVELYGGVYEALVRKAAASR